MAQRHIKFGSSLSHNTGLESGITYLWKK